MNGIEASARQTATAAANLGEIRGWDPRLGGWGLAALPGAGLGG